MQPYRATRQLRSTDFDLYGHLNQAVYHELLEDARIGFLLGLEGATLGIVVARVELDYRREVPFGVSEVEVEVSVARVGGSSFTLAQTIRLPDGATAAEGVTVLAAWDGEKRGSRQLTPEERSALEARLTPAAASG